MLIFVALLITLFVLVYYGLQLESIGKEPSGERLARIRASPNYQNGSFQNLTETPVSGDNPNYFLLLYKFIFGKSSNAEPSFRLPSVRTNLKLATPPKAPTFTYFGHSSYLIQIQGKAILMDPVFCERTSPVQFFGSKNFLGTNVYGVKDMPEIDFVILSHDHYDHMDYETLKQLASRNIKFVVPLGVGAHLEHWKVPPRNITELDWWDSTELLKDLKLVSTPARHFSGRGLKRSTSLWSSYVLQTPDYKIFLGGDSGYEKHFKKIGEQYGPFDLAILECGQYNEMWPYIHMFPEQVAEAAGDLEAKMLWPVHWSKFSLALHAWNEPPERVTIKAKELGIPLTTPKIGEQIVLNEKYPNELWWRIDESAD